MYELFWAVMALAFPCAAFANAPPSTPGKSCPKAAAVVPYVVDLGPADGGGGPSVRTEVDKGPRVRATLTALTAPEQLDAFNFAAYLPYYVARAYQSTVAAGHTGLRGTVRVELSLDAEGTVKIARVDAPGFPAAFVTEVRERSRTRYPICAPLPTPATVQATIVLGPRPPAKRPPHP